MIKMRLVNLVLGRERATASAKSRIFQFWLFSALNFIIIRQDHNLCASYLIALVNHEANTQSHFHSFPIILDNRQEGIKETFIVQWILNFISGEEWQTLTTERIKANTNCSRCCTGQRVIQTLFDFHHASLSASMCGFFFFCTVNGTPPCWAEQWREAWIRESS